MPFFKLILVLLLLSLSACATKPEQVKKPYLQEAAEQFMQAGIENYQRYQYAAALNQFDKAREIYTRYNDYQGMVNAELNLCKVQIAVGLYDKALQQLLQLDVLIEHNKSQQQAVYRDIMLSSIYLLKTNFEAASRVLAAYEDKLQNNSIDDKTLMAALLINRVRLAEATSKDFESWLMRFEQFVSVNNSSIDYKLRLYRFKAERMQNMGNAAESNRYYSKTLDAYRQLADPIGVMSTLLEWAHAYSERGEWSAAGEHYQGALETGLINYNYRVVEQSLQGLKRVFDETGKSQSSRVINDWQVLLTQENGLNKMAEQYNSKLLD